MILQITLFSVRSCLGNMKSELQKNRTSRLWLQYMDMIDILRQFLRAECKGNWELHLDSLSKMLPYLAAAGHNLYTKSINVYLQHMSKLESTHSEVYNSFMSGHHVVRRSDRQWAGLSTDLVIEQVLMRSVKTSGGLTRGRGMTEQQRVTWLLSMPACADVNRAMHELTGVNFCLNYQNKDMSKTCMGRDMKDTNAILCALEDHSPFSTDPSLRNIMTGITADKSMNVDNAFERGENTLSSMAGKSVLLHVFKRKDQVTTLGVKSSIKVDGQTIQIDPQLLFHRLVIASKSFEENKSYFAFELCTFPTSMFESPHMLRQPQKSLLAEAIWNMVYPKEESVSAPSSVNSTAKYVLDGGALLHRIPWPKGSPTYKEVCMVYCDYVTRKYGHALIIFDGYESANTKDMVHKKHSSGKISNQINFTEEMKVIVKKEVFRTNTVNKQRFINMLGKHLAESNCEVVHAKGDADCDIVQSTVTAALRTETVVDGDDTDLLVLLCHHADLNNTEIYLYSEAKGSYVCKHLLFVHTKLGYDTTSRFHGIGKQVAIRN